MLLGGDGDGVDGDGVVGDGDGVDVDGGDVVDGDGDGVDGDGAYGGQVERSGICWFSQSVKCDTSAQIPRESTAPQPIPQLTTPMRDMAPFLEGSEATRGPPLSP